MNKELFQMELRNKNYAKMKTSFYLHGYINRQGQTQVFFRVVINKAMERIPTGFFLYPKEWSRTSQRSKSNPDLNIILDNMEAKAIHIKTFYRLSERVLDLPNFIEDFTSQTPSFDFLAFMKSQFLTVKNPNTLKKYNSVLKKLKAFKKTIPFHSMDLDFFKSYRFYLGDTLKNNKTTINTNVSVIKTYMRIAKKNGVHFNINLEDIAVGSTAGNRTSLSKDQIKKLWEYFHSGFIKDSHKLALGYFLISCFTGFRVSDIQQLKRKDVENDSIFLQTVKGKKFLTIKLNATAKKVIAENENLFNQFYSDQYINRLLKEIATLCGIYNNLSMHIGRHTFATSYIKSGGDITYLQVLLGHTKLQTTMIYTHISQDDANETINILDDYFFK